MILNFQETTQQRSSLSVMCDMLVFVLSFLFHVLTSSEGAPSGHWVFVGRKVIEWGVSFFRTS